MPAKKGKKQDDARRRAGRLVEPVAVVRRALVDQQAGEEEPEVDGVQRERVESLSGELDREDGDARQRDQPADEPAVVHPLRGDIVDVGQRCRQRRPAV